MRDNLYAMLHQISYNKSEVLDCVECYPTVSIILPFEPKMSVHRELEYQLARVCNQVEQYLEKNYSPETLAPVRDKLKELARKIDFTSFKKSVAIFVSPVFNKVMYLDIAVNERVIIDEAFGIRDIVHSKKDEHEFLVLKIDNENSKIFLGNEEDLNCIVTTIRRPRAIEKGKPIAKHIDDTLSLIHGAYNLPVFVIGTKENIQQFKAITQHADYVNQYIVNNEARNSTTIVQKLVKPYLADWKEVKTRYLLQQLRVAAKKGRLSTGIHETWRQASRKRGRLLVIEENYTLPEEDAHHVDTDDRVISTTFHIRDKVDEVIENVLQNGGDVEFVEEGVLEDYNHIALI